MMKLSDIHCLTEKNESGVISGKSLGWKFLFEEASLSKGSSVTSFSYLCEQENRPVVFITNGGPGSSVSWQLLGFFAPVRIALLDGVNTPTEAPFTLEENPYSPLAYADLVLIDPPGCGYSSFAKEDNITSVDEDAEIIAEYIERWLCAHHRMNRKFYLCGESYGTIRMPAVTDALYGGPFSLNMRMAGLMPSGVILIGSAINHHSRNIETPIWPECVSLLAPGACAFAYHHGKNVSDYRQKAEALESSYVRALYLGKRMKKEEREELAEEISRLTGLSNETLLAQNLSFSKEQLLTCVVRGKSIGMYDGRYVMNGTAKPGTFPFPGMKDPVADDAAMGRYCTAFTQGMRLFAEKMGLPDKPYVMIDFAINSQWSYECRHAAMESLENSARRNPSFRILSASGMYDFCTPYPIAAAGIADSSLDPDRVSLKLYPSGHMIYVGDESAALFEKDLVHFLEDSDEKL